LKLSLPSIRFTLLLVDQRLDFPNHPSSRFSRAAVQREEAKY
jgi:hypothetical protein